MTKRPGPVDRCPRFTPDAHYKSLSRSGFADTPPADVRRSGPGFILFPESEHARGSRSNSSREPGRAGSPWTNPSIHSGRAGSR